MTRSQAVDSAARALLDVAIWPWIDPASPSTGPGNYDVPEQAMHVLRAALALPEEESEIAALRERAERAERERDDVLRRLAAATGYREGHPLMCCGQCHDTLAASRSLCDRLAEALGGALDSWSEYSDPGAEREEISTRRAALAEYQESKR